MHHGANPNGRNKANSCPLSTAIHSNKNSALRALLQAGANPDTRYIPKSKFDTWPRGTPLLRAINSKSFEAVQILLDFGADPNLPDLTEQYPLECAIVYSRQGQTEYARALLLAGANPNQVFKQKLTAVQFARAYERPEIASLLIEFGAKES